MGAGRDDDDDVGEVDSAFLEMAKHVGKHARRRGWSIEIIDQHHRGLLPAAQLTNGLLANRRLELRGDLIVRERRSETRRELFDVPSGWQAQMNLPVAVPCTSPQHQRRTRICC